MKEMDVRSEPVSSVLLREVGIRPGSLRLRRKERYEGEGRVQISWTLLSHAANGPGRAWIGLGLESK